MMVDVHIYGGAVIRFVSRGQMITLIRRDPATLDQGHALAVWIDRGQGEGFVRARLQYVKKSAIALVEQVPVDARDAWLAEHAPDVLEQIRAKEAARGAATKEVAA